MEIKRFRKPLVDVMFSLIAYALPTAVLTLVIQPILAVVLGGELNGLFLTKISIIRFCVSFLIASLANTKLLESPKYSVEKNSGDFNLLLTLSVFIGFVIVCTFSVICDPQASLFDTMLTGITFALIALHDYLSIYYRVVVNFKMIVIDNALITVGYALGTGTVLLLSGCWQLVFIIGYAIGTTFVCCTSPYWKEKLSRTTLWKRTRRKYLQLSASNALTESVNYCDRFLIYPFLGGNSVSIYNAASVMGKAIQIVSVPIQRVLLSYVVRREKMTKLEITRILIGSSALFFFVYIIICFSSGFVISLIYPAFYEDAKPLIWIVLLGTVVNTLAGFLNTLLLRFSKSRNQIWLSGIRLISYIVVALSLLSGMQLMAVGLATLVSSILRLCFVTFLLLKTVDE